MDRRTRRILIVWLGLAAAAQAAPAQLIRASFDQPPDNAYLSLTDDAAVADGVLHTASIGAWKRGGLAVGPIPVPKAGALTVDYDFKPVAFTNQGQSFVSEWPSTHWYMVYVAKDGALRLHTRHDAKWQCRGQSKARVKLGAWTHAHVTLKRVSIRIVFTERDSGKPVWDTGEAPMDDIGESTTFMLTDESPTAKEGATEWDNVSLSTDDAKFAQRFVAEMKRVAAAKARREAMRAAAQTAAQGLRDRDIALIPIPQQIRFGDGEFDLGKAALSFPAALEADAKLVQAILKEWLGRKLPLKPGRAQGVVLNQVESGPWPAAKTRPCEGYRLVAAPTGVRIDAQTREGFLCAAQTLAQLARDGRPVPAVEIVDWPAIENRLVMIALSQGGWRVIHVPYWKRMIRELAAAKINMIMPYMDGGTFDYRKYPFICQKGKGGMTVAKARLLSDYAYAHGIEIAPQTQTLGHSWGVLRHKELADLRESGGVFCSSNPKTFEFFGDMFDDMVEAFPHARHEHVGGDEFGHGFAKCPKCKAKAAKIGKEGLYAEHMMHVRKMLADRGRQMMIWWHEGGLTDAAADLLAKDIIVFDWHYGNQRSYPSIKRLQKEGFIVWATPAITRYYQTHCNDYSTTFGNIRGFLTAAVERGLTGECTCTWVHGLWGGRNHFELNYYGLLYSAQCAWKPANSDEEDFRWRMARHWFGLDGEGLAEQMLYAWHEPFGPTKEQGFWRSCRDAAKQLAARPAATIAEIEKSPKLLDECDRLEAFCQRARGVLEGWKTKAKRNQVTIDFLIHDVHIYETLVRRIRTMDALRRAYPQKQWAAIEPVTKSLQTLIADYREIERMFERSILEAGGGPSGRLGLSAGGIRFDAPKGREGIEKLAAKLAALKGQKQWPEKVW